MTTARDALNSVLSLIDLGVKTLEEERGELSVSSETYTYLTGRRSAFKRLKVSVKELQTYVTDEPSIKSKWYAESLEELENLPYGSVIRVNKFNTILEKFSDGWYTTVIQEPYTPHENWFPAEILYTPEGESK